MSIFILGCGGCGKSVTLNKFLEKHPTYNRIVPYTTRPKRKNEIDGVDYHFVDYHTFKSMKHDFAIIERYNDDWYYGTLLRDCNNSMAIGTLSFNGFKQLIQKKIKCKNIFYLYVSPKDRFKKMLERGDNAAEASRRCLTDSFDETSVLTKAVAKRRSPILISNSISEVTGNYVLTPEQVADQIYNMI